MMNKVKKASKSSRDMGFPMKNGQKYVKNSSNSADNWCIFGNLLDSEMEKLKNGNAIKPASGTWDKYAPSIDDLNYEEDDGYESLDVGDGYEYRIRRLS